MAFDGPVAYHVNRICEVLIRSGMMRPIVVVAVESGGQRSLDYTPWAASYWTPNGGGNAYLAAIRDTLKPLIDARYRTLRDPAHTGIAGVSLGGLIAVYAGYAYAGTFGLVGALSPAYGYADDAIYTLAATTGRPSLFRRFFQATGYPHDNPITDMAIVAQRQGFVVGVDFQTRTVNGGDHSPQFWEAEYPDLLAFLFPPGLEE